MNTHDVPKDFVETCYQCGEPIVGIPPLVIDEHPFCGWKCGEAHEKEERVEWRGWLFIVIAVVFSLMLFMFAQSSHANHEVEQQYTEYESENLAVCFTKEGGVALTQYFLMGGWEQAERMFNSIKSCEMWTGKFIILVQSEPIFFGEETVYVIKGLTNRNNEFYFLGLDLGVSP